MADQEFLASFGVEIDESGVSRLQAVLEENRTLADSLAASFAAASEAIHALAEDLGCDWIPADDLSALSPDLVIYTVPGSMDSFPDFPGAVILEANYRTPCLEGRGKAYVSGLRWLLYQAVAGYEIFTGETPDADAMFRIFC